MKASSALPLLPTLLINEARMRLRRPGTFITFILLVIISWISIPDPHSGSTLIKVEEARVLYTSAALALGSAITVGPFFGIAGFYLLRGRIDEDLRLGLGTVIASTSMSNRLFLCSRWLGGVLYLCLLLLGLLLTTVIYQLLHGEGGIEFMLYLQTYSLLLLPSIIFVSACALLFDSVPFLMGKFGDVLFFFIWITQIALMAALEHGTAAHINFMPMFTLDFLGLGSGVLMLTSQLHTANISVGIASFDPSIPAISFAHLRWPLSMLAMRASAALLALLPLLPALILFHRFSPDRVKASHSSGRRKLLPLMNAKLRPLVRLVQPLFVLAQRSSGLFAHVCAEVALSFSSFPIAILALSLSYLFSILSSSQQLPAVLIPIIAFWGIFISDISCRDHRAQLLGMVCAVSGGRQSHNARELIAAFGIGLLFTAPIIGRYVFSHAMSSTHIGIHYGIQIASLIVGIFCLSAIANLFGRCTGSARLFMAVFLFALYVALNAKDVSDLDIVGFNGVANLHSICLYALIGLSAWFASVLYQARHDRR